MKSECNRETELKFLIRLVWLVWLPLLHDLAPV